MVVAARLDWIRRQVVSGTHVYITVGPARDANKCKIKATIEPSRPPLRSTSRAALLGVLDAVTIMAALGVSVDRGHRHHDSGKSEVALWLQTGTGSSGPEYPGAGGHAP